MAKKTKIKKKKNCTFKLVCKSEFCNCTTIKNKNYEEINFMQLENYEYRSKLFCTKLKLYKTEIKPTKTIEIISKFHIIRITV